jgi:hypothetical protein
MNWTFIIICVAVIVLLVVIGLAKHFGWITAIGLFGKLLSFVEDLLVAAGWVKSGSGFDKIARIVVSGIILVYTSGADGTLDEKVTSALNYITSTCEVNGIELTEDQITILKTILTTGFNFLAAKTLTSIQKTRLRARVAA